VQDLPVNVRDSFGDVFPRGILPCTVVYLIRSVNTSFQMVFIVSRCHFSYVLPTWFLLFITTKYPIEKIHWC